MKILVTGGAGFIGNRVVKEALSCGHTVVNFDALTASASLSSVWELEEDPGYALEIGDISDAGALAGVLDSHTPDAVIHLAGESRVDQVTQAPHAALETNVKGTFTLLEACRHYWVARGRAPEFRFCMASSASVYGDRLADGPAREGDAFAPTTPHAATMAAALHFAQAWHHTYGLPVVATHGVNTYGPWQSPEHFVPQVLARAVAGQPVSIHGDGHQMREWLHVNDHARAILAAVERGVPGQSYNLGSGGALRVLDVARALCRQLQAQRPSARLYSDLLTHEADRPGQDRHQSVRADRAAQELGWEPEVNLEDGLGETVSWYLAHGGWSRPSLPERRGASARDAGAHTCPRDVA